MHIVKQDERYFYRLLFCDKNDRLIVADSCLGLMDIRVLEEREMICRVITNNRGFFFHRRNVISKHGKHSDTFVDSLVYYPIHK